jgi:RNA recognition motif-containing protein
MLNKIVNDKSLSSSNASLNSIETGNNNIHNGGNTNNTNDRTVYLGDLDLDMTEKQLMDFFNKSAPSRPNITKIVKQPHSSFAHITCEDPAVAKSLLENAIIKINNKVIRVMPFNQPNNFDPNANLIIKNLESYVNESNIIQKFKEFGDILSCKLVRDEEGSSKCYAFLQYKDKHSADVAIDKYNNTYWDERCDPDFKFRKYQEKLLYLNNHQSLGKLNEADLQENELFADFSNKLGKKIYVGVFKKREEYSKIKSDKEGKPSNLYVKNFGTNFGDRDLFNLFKVYGSIKSAKVRRLKVGPIEKPLGMISRFLSLYS